MEEYLRVGVISSTHGLKGEVKVFPTTDDNGRFKKLKEIILDTEGEYRTLHIEKVRFFKQMVILKFKEYDRIEDIMPYKGRDLLVERKDAVALNENEYFIYDIIGADVVTEDAQMFGTLKEVLVTGANDVYVVERTGGGEVLLPVIKECVLDVDTIGKKVTIRLMPGLLDE